MKKVLCLILAFTLMLCCGCSRKGEAQEAVAMLDKYLENVDNFENCVQEVGTATSFVDAYENYVISIIYPETEIAPLNEAISAWIDETVATYKKDADKEEAYAIFLKNRNGSIGSVRLRFIGNTYTFESYDDVPKEWKGEDAE